MTVSSQGYIALSKHTLCCISTFLPIFTPPICSTKKLSVPSPVFLNSNPVPPITVPALITELSPIIVFSLIETNSSIVTLFPITTLFSATHESLLIAQVLPITVGIEFLLYCFSLQRILCNIKNVTRGYSVTIMP